MSRVVALDPGVEYALALFLEGVLHHVAFQHIPFTFRNPDVLVVERPVVYSGGAPSTSVVTLSINAGIILGALGGTIGSWKEVPTVALGKSIIKTRVRRTLTELERTTLDECLRPVPVSMQNNCYDSVRHGLHYLGRLGR